ncbi:hypothetical protein IQ277_20255 [Nostocales cyanobacterium LEGE 12452]|nr:hypothetical protein [Nostocales cyanobacterium LEGE 12452]
MAVSHNQFESENPVWKTFSESLGLKLNDSEMEILLQGEELSLQELFRNHSLVEIANLLIQLDIMLHDINQKDIVSLTAVETLDERDFSLDSRLRNMPPGNCNCPPGCTCRYLLLGVCIKNCANQPLVFYLPPN